MRDFILSTFTKKVKILLQKKSDVYKVTAVDDKLLVYNKEMVDQEIKETRLYIISHVQDMQFNIMLTDRCDIMLELL